MKNVKNRVESGVVHADTIRVDSAIISGTAKFDGIIDAVGDIKTQNKLTVGGNATFSGAMKLSSLSGSSGNLVVDALGNVNKVPSIPIISCIAGSPQWSMGGDNFLPYSSTNPVGVFSEASIGTCNNHDFILKSNAVNRAWFKTDGTISFGANIASNTGGTEYKFHQGVIRLSGFNTYGGPQMIFDGGISPYGDWGIEYAPTQFTKPGLNFWKPFGSPNAFNYLFFLADDGTIGVGTDNPSSRLTVDGWAGDGFKVMSDNNTNSIDVFNKNTGKTEFRVKSNGIAYAREVIVTLNNFPDYVFANSYKLPSLSDVKRFINENHRLINMPSAKQIESEGANLGEIQKVTVEKLEEAYLYILQLEEKINSLSKKVELLENKK